MLSTICTDGAPSLSAVACSEQSKSLLILSSFFWQPIAKESAIDTKIILYIVHKDEVFMSNINAY